MSSEELERTFLRLVNCASASDLQTFVDRHFMRTFDFVHTVRTDDDEKQFFEYVSHLNKRLRANMEQLRLPLEQIVTTLVTSDNSAAQNLASVYLRMCLAADGESNERIVAALPTLVESLGRLPPSVRDDVMRAILRPLTSLAEVDKESWPSFAAVCIDGAACAYLSDVLLDLMLMPTCAIEADAPLPPGLSQRGFVRLSKLTGVQGLQLAATKFCGRACGTLLTDHTALTMLLVASVDTSNLAAEVELKKLDTKELLEDIAVVKGLYRLILGDPVAQGGRADVDQRRPVALRHKLKLAAHLVRSRRAAGLFPLNVQFILGVLLPQGDNVPHKLQSAAIDFVPPVVDSCPEAYRAAYYPILFKATRQFLDKCDNDRLLVRGYVSLAKIGAVVPKLLVSDMAYLQRMFALVAEGSDSVSSSAADCLAEWLPPLAAASHDDQHCRSVLLALALAAAYKESARSRRLALKFVHSMFCAPDQLEVFWLLMLLSATDRDDTVRMEATRVLRKSLTASTAPAFSQLMQFLGGKLAPNAAKYDASTVIPIAVQCGRKVMSLSTGVQCVASQAGDSIDDRSPFAFSAQAEDSAELCQHVDKLDDNAVSVYVDFLFQWIKCQADVSCLQMLHEASVLFPDVFRRASSTLADASRFKALCVGSNLAELCRPAAVLYAALLGSNVTDALRDHLRALASSKAHPSHGDYWLLAALANQVRGSQSQPDEQCGAVLRQCEDALLQPILPSTSHFHHLLEPALTAASMFYRGGKSSYASHEFITEWLGKLAQMCQSTKESVTSRAREQAALCLGCALANDADTVNSDAMFEAVVNSLMKIGEGPPQSELQLSVGDALVSACLGAAAPARRNPMRDTMHRWMEARANDGSLCDERMNRRLGALVETMCREKLRHANRHLRQASVIWLYALAQCTVDWLPGAKSRLQVFQHGFITGLPEQNELTQELAGQGISLVFNASDERGRGELVQLLVSSMTGGVTDLQPKVTDDIRLSEIDVHVPTATSSGGSAPSSYRELCTLANDVGDPKLVYRLMPLARNQALWNTKLGAASGFSQMLAAARSQMEPHLPKLVPKLFRYRYDPEKQVQISMRRVWNTLLAERKSVIDEYSLEIFTELLAALTVAEWRVRESSCYAMSDLLSTHSTVRMLPHFAELWRKTFLVLDDMKETVRVGATRMATTLIKVTVRYATKGQSAGEGGTMLSDVIQVLVGTTGLGSSVTLVKATAVGCLSELVQSSSAPTATDPSGHTDAFVPLRGHLAALMSGLLQALSDAESPQVNYLATRCTAEEMEVLDQARAAVTARSPLMDTLSTCVRLIDTADALDSVCAGALVPELRSAVGLPSRMAACALLGHMCVLCERLLGDNEKIVASLLSALTPGLADRNATVRRTYATAVSRLAKLPCAGRRLRRMVAALAESFVASLPDSLTSDTGGLVHVAHALADNCPDRLTDYAPQLAPTVLLATAMFDTGAIEKSDSSERLCEIWNSVWHELVPGTEGGLRLYSNEIIPFNVGLLRDTGVRPVRAAAASVLGKYAELVGSGAELNTIVVCGDALVPSLSGTTWPGKEHILDALAAVFDATSKRAGELAAQTKHTWYSAVKRECDKKRCGLVYRAAALRCVASFVLHVDAIGAAHLALTIVDPVLKPEAGTGDKSDDEETAAQWSHADWPLLQCAAVSLLASAARRLDCVDSDVVLARLLDALALGVNTDSWHHWSVHLATTDAFARVFHCVRSEGNQRFVALETGPYLRVVAEIFARATQSSLIGGCERAAGAIVRCAATGKCRCSTDCKALHDERQCVADLMAALKRVCDDPHVDVFGSDKTAVMGFLRELAL